MEIFRNIKRRKFRSLITIAGITVGIFALTVMGSLAESLNLTIMNMNKHFAEKVMITEQGTQPGMGLMPEYQIAKLFDHQDVAAVVPMLLAIYDDAGTFNIGGPSQIQGVLPDDIVREFEHAPLSQGQWFSTNSKEVVLGSGIAGVKKVSIGSNLQVRDTTFKVVGILQRTGTPLDNNVTIPIELAQDILGRPGLVSTVSVYPVDGITTDELAVRLRKDLVDLDIISPAEMRAQLAQTMVVWNAK